MLQALTEFTNRFLAKYLTISRGKPEISKTREVSTSPIREVKKLAAVPTKDRLVIDSLSCPYCLSQNFQKRGFRQKKLERVQLYLCLSCNKTFTPYVTKRKHYPLKVMFDAISIYNLGYSLEETCRIVNARHQKTASFEAAVGTGIAPLPAENITTLTYNNPLVKRQVAEDGGLAPQSQLALGPHQFSAGAASSAVHLPPSSVYQKNNNLTMKQFSNVTIQPSTLANWLKETEELCKFNRMREFAARKYTPREMVTYVTLAHQQLYHYRYHRAKCELMIREEYQHRKFLPLKEFLEMVPVECPHQYFQEGLRASEAPLTFSKKQMIVRAKQNHATKLCAFVLQSVNERKERHEALQKFILANDSVTVATEVPVYLTRDDLEHMKTQLGFELFGEMPKLITGHIDLLQIRNGQIHILDYKPRAEKEKPIEQLTLYAMALSRLTGLRLFEFKCAWFDEKDYFEFYPLHVLYKPKKTSRKRKIATNEGIYKVNYNPEKFEYIRPVATI